MRFRSSASLCFQRPASVPTNLAVLDVENQSDATYKVLIDPAIDDRFPIYQQVHVDGRLIPVLPTKLATSTKRELLTIASMHNIKTTRVGSMLMDWYSSRLCWLED